MKEVFFASLLFFIPASFIERISRIEARNISGKVIAFDDSLPVEGVTITVKGTHKTTGTQADGAFYIRVQAPEDSVLILSASGFQTQELKLTSRIDYDVALRRSNR